MTEEPDWSQAPLWAMYWTRDASGAAVWWETKPLLKQKKHGAWLGEDNSRRQRASDVPILVKRPQSK